MTLPEHRLLQRRLATSTGNANGRNTLEQEDASLRQAGPHQDSSLQDTSRQDNLHDDPALHEDSWVTNFVARLAGLVRHIGGGK